MRLDMADLRRLRRAVDAVMRLRQIDPDDADRIVRSGLERRLAVAGRGVPEQIGVVVKLRIALNPVHLPRADRQRIVVTSAGNGRVEQHAAKLKDRLAALQGADASPVSVPVSEPAM